MYTDEDVMSLSDDQRDLIQTIFKEDRALFYRVARSVVRSDTMAEDVVSDAMIKIIEKKEKILSFSRPQMRSYCVILVRNIAYDYMRARSKGDIPVKPGEADAVTHLTPEDEIIEKEQNRLIADAIDTLSPAEQALVHLRYYEKCGYKEIASRLRITEETAKKRGQRILEKLRKLL